MLPLEFTVFSKQIILNSSTASNYVVCYQLGLLEIWIKFKENVLRYEYVEPI